MLYPVPLVNELTDGDANAHGDCVPACIASGLDFLTGRPYTSAAIKDAVYGVGYVGATDPARFIPYCASQGVRMWEIGGGSTVGDVLVPQVLSLLAAPGPIVVTGAIPSLWGNSFPGGQVMVDFDTTHPGQGTHEVLWCGTDGALLAAMNPWQPLVTFPPPTHYQEEMPSWWVERIVYGRVFALELTIMSQISPIWDVAAGTLTYPAHDGLPQIVLSHAQAYYAHTSRVGVYPLTGSSYDGAGNDHVPWSDSLESEAVKASNWAIQLNNIAAKLAAGLSASPAVDTAGIITEANAIKASADGIIAKASV